MARQFITGNTLTCAAGNVAGASRAVTAVVVIRPFRATFGDLSTNTSLITGLAAGAATFGMTLSGSALFGPDDFIAGPAASDRNTWYKLLVSKDVGGTWRKSLATIGGTWTHVDGSSGRPDGAGGTDSILFGQGPIIAIGDFEIAAAAVFEPMSNAAIEATVTDDMADWLAGGPLSAWQFNQADTGDPVTDLTGGGADQTALTGTTVVADPAGFTFLTPPAGGTLHVRRGGVLVPTGLSGVARVGGTPQPFGG